MTDKELEERYLNKVITVGFPGGVEVTGKVDRITIWKGRIIFMFKFKKYEIDEEYFTDENVIIHGNTSTGASDGEIFCRV